MEIMIKKFNQYIKESKSIGYQIVGSSDKEMINLKYYWT